ncbi:MAG TPA: DegV family protein [Acidimicrobiales bacterium]|nr:DegV family protein [Acidimicrobiales bacterium]
MAGVRVVTDSASDLTEDLARQYDVRVVPLTIRFGEEELVDRRDLSPDEFWRRCESSAALPETAAPSPGAFQEAYEDAAAAGAEGVVCVTISAALSATYQAARAAADAVADRIPVRVVDSRFVTMGEGLLVVTAAEAAAGGASLDEVAEAVEDAIGRTRVYGAVATLDHLQRGGRIGGAKAMLGSLLSIKPVICVRDGEVAEESKQRTRGRSLEYLAGKVKADAPLERLAVADGNADDLDVLLERLGDIEATHPMVVAKLGPVVGTHAGPGTVGVAYQLPAGRSRTAG